MKKSIFLLGCISAMALTSCDSEKAGSVKDSAAKMPYELVNPFIGTGGHGHTYPGATVPFGMVQLSPDTRLEGWDGCSGYHYTDSVIYGFSHTHLSGTGVSDYGDVLLSPYHRKELVSLDDALQYKHTTSQFNKAKEEAHPAHYKVHLEDANVSVELTATQRVGIHQYEFNNAENNHILLNLKHRDKVTGSAIQIENATTISGYRASKAWARDQRVYFVMEFSKPFNHNSLGEDSTLFANLTFLETEKLMVKVALSSTSIEGARLNLQKEAASWDFNEYLNAAKSTWEKALSKIEVKGKDQEKLSIFYSSLYHTMIAPNVMSDVDGKYRGMDGEVHENKEDDTYTIFSLWDTFRTAHPLYTIIEQDRTKSFIQTFLHHYEQGGRLPVWELAGNETDCMIGYHSISVITDAYNKGITGFDTELALTAMKGSAESDKFGLEYYQNKGYISAGDEAESVSKTLEYAYDDWCIAQFADRISMGGEHNTTVNDYSQRALYYRNLFDPETRFLRARMNGDWFKPFDPTEVNFNYTEANAWQYSLFAPHDVSGIINLIGGDEAFEKHLDQLFTTNSETTGREQADITGLIGQYAHGNEPSHHMAYLYNYIQKPWKTQERVHQILNEQYQNAPDGLSGNEDCGQMSAWYVMSSMGFYPVTPGLDYYTIGTPLFDSVTLNLENGNQFHVVANGISDANRYIQSAQLNGENHTASMLNHQAIMAGGSIVFEMGPNPNKEWGSGDNNYPVAKALEESFVAAPFISTEGMTFTDSLLITIGSIDTETDLQYAINNSDYKTYTAPFYINRNVDLKVYSMPRGGKLKSHTLEVQYKKIKKGRSIELKSEYANQYSAAGKNSLIDQLRGNTNYRTGFWQGYRGQNVEAIVNLGKVKEFTSLSAGFLQDVKSWIWYPDAVEFYISEDGEDFSKVATIKNEFSEQERGSFIQDLSYTGTHKAQYVKMIAKYNGDCPEWHPGAGGKSWMFIDEISIETED